MTTPLYIKIAKQSTLSLVVLCSPRYNLITNPRHFLLEIVITTYNSVSLKKILAKVIERTWNQHLTKPRFMVPHDIDVVCAMATSDI